MKDLFSTSSQLYQQARPSYPQEVVQEILKYVSEHHFAWDCGAGSGQFTQLLAPYFDHIVATDISQQQLQQAPYFDNVSYQLQSSEKTTFAEKSFDLITVAQAIHWFDFDEFYREVARTLKPQGILAVVGYGLISVENEAINQCIQQIYHEKLKVYWDPERRFIDEEYQTIPFPLEEIVLVDSEISQPKFEIPTFKMKYLWTSAQLLKYLSTWSAVRHYLEKNNINPLLELAEILPSDDEELQIEFPIFLRIGKLKASRSSRFMKK